MLWLPKQAPELNPMDHLWRETKRNVSANWQYDTVDDHAQTAEDWIMRLTNRQAHNPIFGDRKSTRLNSSH